MLGEIMGKIKLSDTETLYLYSINLTNGYALIGVNDKAPRNNKLYSNRYRDVYVKYKGKRYYFKDFLEGVNLEF